MKRILPLIIALVASMYCVPAQNKQLVSGTIVNAVDGAPLSKVDIFIFKNIEVCKEEYKNALSKYENNDFWFTDLPHYFYRTEKDGSFEITVDTDNAIILSLIPFKPLMIEVNGRTDLGIIEIDTTIPLQEAGISIDTSIVKKPKKKAKRNK